MDKITLIQDLQPENWDQSNKFAANYAEERLCSKLTASFKAPAHTAEWAARLTYT
jgi:hypothetical protein